ncbi:MAG: PAQR family membrane homeostasis protein TrhA [Acidobacteriota bacterium]
MYRGERLNASSHLLGLALALLGAPALIARASAGDDWRTLIGASVFGATMVALYAASSLYHCARGQSKEFWAKADHCAIYLLIAGTYTPITLVTLHGPLGYGLLFMEWALALVGIVKELGWGRATVPSVPLYVVMGWAGVAAGSTLMTSLPAPGWIVLLAGGLLYTVGITFYVLDHRLKHAHGIWHFFVLGGTACHFYVVWRFVV